MLPATNLALRAGSDEGAPALVMLHVFGLARREWIEAGVKLARQFRVICFDTPGFGDADEVRGYSVGEMADRFAESIAQLKLGRLVLVGHSMTGKVAAVLARRGLPGLEGVVLLTPSPVSPEPIAAEARASMLAQAEPTREDAEAYVRGNSALPIPPEVFERSVEDRLRANPAAWRAWLEAGSYEDWSERVGADAGDCGGERQVAGAGGAAGADAAAFRGCADGGDCGKRASGSARGAGEGGGVDSGVCRVRCGVGVTPQR